MYSRNETCSKAGFPFKKAFYSQYKTLRQDASLLRRLPRFLSYRNRHRRECGGMSRSGITANHFLFFRYVPYALVYRGKHKTSFALSRREKTVRTHKHIWYFSYLVE